MTDPDDVSDATRRTVLKAIAGSTAVAGVAGTASAHESDSGGNASNDGHHDHTDASVHGATSDVELLDYHSLGDVGPSGESGSADSPHYGGISELRTHGDYAYVGVFSSDTPTGDRGLFVVDISAFNGADNTSDLREADLDVVAILRNDNPAAAVMDVKVSDDGNYVFLGKQPFTALFNETDPAPDDDGEGTSASAAAVQAVDVSDPTDPRVVGTYDAWDTGPHNLDYHRVDGTDYVFAVKDFNDGTSGIWVFRFDRTTGAIAVVNKWDAGGNLTDGNLVDEDLNYAHDIVVQDDPRLGIPVGYFSYWNSGLFALDLSVPTSIEPIGHFSMPVTHYAEPAPSFVDGKRIVVAGQEQSSQSDGTSGYVKLLDADGLDDGYDGSDNITELDTWEWQSNVSFASFTLSPHNFTVTDDGWVHLGHYHGGTRFLRYHSENWTLEEKGYFQAARDVPEESKAGGINDAAPFTWTAVEHEGVVYAADVNTGVYALRHKPSSSNGMMAPLAALGVGGLATKYADRISDRLPGLDAEADQ
jgi:hypothetical protein